MTHHSISIVLQLYWNILSPMLLSPTFCRLLATQHRSLLIHQKLSSNYKRRPQLSALPPDKLEQIKTHYLQERTDLQADEWTEVRQSLIDNYKHINTHNVDAVILGICNEPKQLALAKNYVQYLTTCGSQPNTATLGRLLRVYNASYHARGSLTDAEQVEILTICEALKSKHLVLDAATCEYLIYGLVATTNKWQDAAEMLDMIKLTSTPSINAYTELVVKAFNEAHLDLGWKLLDEMLLARKQPKCDIFIAYLQHIAKSATTDTARFVSYFEQFMSFLERHDMLITLKVAQRIEELSKEIPNMQVAFTSLDRLGKCKNCEQYLQHVSITNTEFAQLSTSFLEKVLIRNDVFQKSTPEEVARFKRYVEETAPYDCVIDGLNVAYSTGSKKPPHILAKLLAAVVRYFKERNKHVLVLGRKHMKSWSKESMHYVHNNASVFLTNDLTHDDPFLLYATLKSGQLTDFFSRDLMRSHAFLLGAELKPIFRRWQQEHQYSLIAQTGSGKIIVKEPIRHRLSTHKVSNMWHVPCRAEYMANPAESFEVPEQWLCIQMPKI